VSCVQARLSSSGSCWLLSARAVLAGPKVKLSRCAAGPARSPCPVAVAGILNVLARLLPCAAGSPLGAAGSTVCRCIGLPLLPPLLSALLWRCGATPARLVVHHPKACLIVRHGAVADLELCLADVLKVSDIARLVDTVGIQVCLGRCGRVVEHTSGLRDCVRCGRAHLASQWLHLSTCCTRLADGNRVRRPM